uniref:Putative RhoGAP-domain-containing protein n=1 Tax=Moniliophthora roreri TaxID=221103 RepID=A0A0W0FMY6_MONRR
MSQQQIADTLPLVGDRICPGCKLSAVTEEGGLVVAFGSSFFHVDCFRCAKCTNKVTADTNLLLLSDGSPICANCSYSCNICHLPILDEAIMTGDDSYHAHCFKCKICHSRIDELVFAKTSQGIYCMNCHNQRMIKIRKHAQKKAEKEKAAAAAGGSSSTSPRERDARLRPRESETTSSPAADSHDLPNPSKSAESTSMSLNQSASSAQSGPYVNDTSQNNHATEKAFTAKSSQPLNLTSAQHPTVFHPPPRTSSVDQGSPYNKKPLLSHPSIDEHDSRRAASYDEVSHQGNIQRTSSGSMDIPSISVPNGNGTTASLNVTSRAEKRRSINPGLSLNNFKAPSSSNTPSYSPSLSPLSATFIGKQQNNRTSTSSQNGRESPSASSPLRDRLSDNELSRPSSSQGSSDSHSAQNHDPNHDPNMASRLRSVSATAAMADDQTVVMRPKLRTNATSDALPTRLTTQTQNLQGRASPIPLRPQRSFDDRPSSREQLSSGNQRSRSASRSRPNSRVDVPHGVESATESETDNEAHESIGSIPPDPPPKEDLLRQEDDGEEVQPLADLLSLKGDVDPQVDSDDNTSESSPVEQTSHATFIAPALPPIRFSLNAGDFSDLFNSVSGAPPLQQLAQLASVTEQRAEPEEDDKKPSTPSPSVASMGLATKVNGPRGARRAVVPAPLVLDRSQSVSSGIPKQTDNSSLGRGRAFSEARAEPHKAIPITPEPSNGSDSTARITISPPPHETNDKPEKPDPTDQVLQRLQEVMADARDRGAQQLKLDRGFVEAIIKVMAARKVEYSELKGSLDGMKRASKQYMEGLTVAQTEYDRELKTRRELEAEVTRLRVLLSGQAARLTALSGDSRRQELRQQMTKELHESLSGLEHDLSKLRVERDMTLAEVEELSASKRYVVMPMTRNVTSRVFQLVYLA